MNELIKLSGESLFKELEQENSAPSSGAISQWLNSSKLIKAKVTSSNFDFFNHRYSHYMMELISNDGQSVVGHGRSTVAEVAFHKAFAESLERYAMKNYFRNKSQLSSHISLCRMENGELSISKLPHKEIPDSFANSNGWAAHFNIREAIKNALFEAVERHSLQLGYWKYGLGFLKPMESQEWNGFKIHISGADTEFHGLKVVVCGVEHSDYPGLYFGHQILENNKRGELAFHHSGIEAIQIAEAGRRDRRVTTLFDSISLKFADSPATKTDFLSGRAYPTPNYGNKFQDLKFSVVAIDLGKSLNMGFNFFVVWAFSDHLVPLYLQDSGNEKSNAWLLHRLEKLGVHLSSITQTPFI